MIAVFYRGLARLVAWNPLATFWASTYFLMYCGFGWMKLDTKEGIMTTLSFEEQWATRNSDQEKEMSAWLKRHNDEPWEQEYALILLHGKGDLAGNDIVTPERMTEMEPLFAKFLDISVTVSGKIYSTWDLCARGSTPDEPNATSEGALYLPCQIVSMFDCFQEMAAYFHPTYQSLDNDAVALADALGGESDGPRYVKAYSARPSYKHMSAAEVKGEVSKVSPITQMRGCPWYTQVATWQYNIWAGNTKKVSSDGILEEAPTVGMYFFYEGPRRAQFRHQFTGGPNGLGSVPPAEDEYREAKKQHVKEFEKAVLEFNDQSANIEATFTKTFDLMSEEFEDELVRVPWVQLIAAFLLTNLFMAVALLSFRHPMQSRHCLGILGFQTVLLNGIGSFGVIFTSGIGVNTTMLGALPFLALGLGMDDMFVMINTFHGLGNKFIRDHSAGEVIAEVLAKAGPGIILTSACNVVAFGLGAMIPVPVLADLSVGACICVAVNFFGMTTNFASCLALEVVRVKYGIPEPQCIQCQTGLGCGFLPESAPCAHRRAPGKTRFYDARFGAWLEQIYAPWLLRAPVNTSICLIGLVMALLGGVAVANKAVGYDPSIVLPKDLPLHRSLELFFESFNVFDAYLVFWDADVPTHQLDMLQLYDGITGTGTSVAHWFPPYLSMMYRTIGGDLTGTPCCANDDSLAPDGIMNSDPEEFYFAWNNFSKWPQSNAEARSSQATYPYADWVMAQEFAYYEDVTPRRLLLSFFPFHQQGFKTGEDYVQTLKDIRMRCEDSPLKGSKAFPYGNLFTFWEASVRLEDTLWKIFAIDIAAIFVCSCVFLTSLRGAIVVSIMCSIIILEVYGICALVLDFNVLIAGPLIAAAGVAVEDVVHTVAHFSFSEGVLEERLGGAMRSTFMAIIQGSLSTIASIIPMAFHPSPFYLSYYFFPFMTIVLCGLLNGLVFTPAVLSFVMWITQPCSRKTNEVTV